MSRRRLLRGVAIAAGGVMLAGCSGTSGQSGGGASQKTKIDPSKVGSHTEPLAPPKSFREAPMLKQLVDSGELPPVEERLPDVPYVPPHKWLETGKYGGRMHLITHESDQENIGELSYGHSLLRYLNDGMDIGPGLVETWDHNADHTEWVLNFRTGLKWSDGQEWSTDDIMHWWEDVALDTEYAVEAPPDDLRSGKDTLAELTAVDAHTLRVVFDAPAPAFAERIAAWANRNQLVGPSWMQPKHYMKQFHVKYNKDLDESWPTTYEQKAIWAKNPDCPVMTGWRAKDYQEGRSVLFERNPYYWAVDEAGNQLPYLDELQWRVIDFETQLVEFTQGNADYAQHDHTGLNLADIPELREAAQQTGVEVRFWDSGSGTGSITFWNYDYPDKKIRDLFRDKNFRRALSYAHDRKRVRKDVYFNSGELTTGTLSPKGVIFQATGEAKKRYEEWRDAFIEYDKKEANKLLDELGLKDVDGDGMRELPDGSKLTLYLEQPADTTNEHKQKNSLIKQDWEAVGIATEINPVQPDAYADIWGRGELMIRTAWEVGDNHPLIYPGWVIPVSRDHWAPLHGQGFVQVTADPEGIKAQEDVDPWKRQPPFLLPEEGDPIDRLWKLYNAARVEPDETKRMRLLWDVVKVHIDDGPFFIGAIANYPRIILVHKELRNVPYKENLRLGGWVNPWIAPTPAVYDPETWFWEEPGEHS